MTSAPALLLFIFRNEGTNYPWRSQNSDTLKISATQWKSDHLSPAGRKLSMCLLLAGSKDVKFKAKTKCGHVSLQSGSLLWNSTGSFITVKVWSQYDVNVIVLYNAVVFLVLFNTNEWLYFILENGNNL